MASLAVSSANETSPLDPAGAPRPALRIVGGPGAMTSASAGARYAERGPNWGAIGIIAAAHAALIGVLLTTGAVTFAGKTPPPVAVNFVEEIAEPTVETPAPEMPMETVAADIFVPDVIIETPVAAPPQLTVTEAPPAPKAIAAPEVAKGGGDSPIVPPDFSADQLNNPGPRYPSASRRAHEEGTVLLKVLVSSDGHARELAIATSSGFARLDDAALDTVRRWAFVPAKQAGRPVSAWVLVPVTFELGDGPSDRRGRGDRRRGGADRHQADVPLGNTPTPSAT